MNKIYVIGIEDLVAIILGAVVVGREGIVVARYSDEANGAYGVNANGAKDVKVQNGGNDASS